MKQTLTLPDFPRPATARTLSPNGRAHWTAKRSETRYVKEMVRMYALIRGLQPMTGQVEIQPTFIYPQQRKRDDDNLATGVMKAVRDGLVEFGYLRADDMDHVVQRRPIVEVQPKKRALILEFRELVPGAAGQPIAAE